MMNIPEADTNTETDSGTGTPLQEVVAPPPEIVEVSRTETPQKLLIPQSDVFHTIARLGLEGVSSLQVADLCNKLCNGAILEDAEILEATRHERKGQHRFFNPLRWGIGFDPILSRSLQFNIDFAEFLRHLAPQSIPGRSGRDQVASLSAVMPEVQRQLLQGKTPAEMAEQLNEAFQEVSDLRPEELSVLAGLPHPVDGLEPEPDGEDESWVADAESAQGEAAQESDEADGSQVSEDLPDAEQSEPAEGEDSSAESEKRLIRDPASPHFARYPHTLKQADIAGRLLDDARLNQLIKVARILRRYSGLRVRSTRRRKADPNGFEVRVRPMKSASEIAKLIPAEWALQRVAPELFKLRLAQNALRVRERVIVETKKQLLYVLADGSGSMRLFDRSYRQAGVLLNRFAAVVSGEAECYFRYFGTDLYPEQYVGDERQAQEAMRYVVSWNHEDEGTKLQFAMQESLRRIEEIVAQGNTERPHLLVITDGEAKLKIPDSLLKETKVHAVLLEDDQALGNDELKRVVKKTAGVLVQHV